MYGNPEGKAPILYLCNGEKADCKKTHCYKKVKDKYCCRHTKDVRYAINFKRSKAGSYTEEPRLETTAQISEETEVEKEQHEKSESNYMDR